MKGPMGQNDPFLPWLVKGWNKWLRMTLWCYKRWPKIRFLSHYTHITFLSFSRSFQDNSFGGSSNPKAFLDKIIIFQTWVSDYYCTLTYYKYERICISCWLWLEVLDMALLVVVKKMCHSWDCDLNYDLKCWWKSMVWIKYQHVWCYYGPKLVIFL